MKRVHSVFRHSLQSQQVEYYYAVDDKLVLRFKVVKPVYIGEVGCRSVCIFLSENTLI